MGRVAAGLAALTVLGEIAYPLLHEVARARLTVAIVLIFALTSLVHAATGGARCVTALASVAVIGFGAEVLGVHVGVPFGTYAYSSVLGIRVLGVPVLVGLAWLMFAWPAALVARRLTPRFAARVAIGTWALASWDLFLDPQLVALRAWRWRFPSPHLPGSGTVPLTDYAGWIVVSALISLVLQAVLRDGIAIDDRIPVALYLWTWVSSALALGAFLDLGAAAGWGAIGMGVIGVPLVRTL